MVSEIPNKTKCVDDVLLWADTIEESFFQAVQWLDTCGNNGITLNPDKFVFAADTVEFAGFEITSDSVRPSHKYLRAILDFPTPTNITEVRSWFGLVNQVSYAFSMTEKMLPFRQLLKPGTPSSGLKTSNDCLWNRRSSLQVRSSRAYEYLTHIDQHVWRRTGPKLALASGCYKSTAHVPRRNHSAAMMDGKSPSLVAGSHTRPSPVTHRSRERL